MEIHCTRPGCPHPKNIFADLNDKATLTTIQQKYCTSCGMPLILADRYLPSKLLGQGGFGAAFLARDRHTPAMRYCVVKQFQPSGDLSPTQLKVAQELFGREAEVLEELGSAHPQIPDLFAFFSLSVHSLQPGKKDQFFYLVQEFVDGQNLEEELHSKGTFSEAEALEVLNAILKVLKFVHESGSIHRDIKPSNIMRHRNGRLYLLDFGAVKQVTKGAGAATGKSTGIYSMGYAPLEQMSGAEVYPSTDLYALAVTVICLLTGKEPGELYDSYNNGWKWRTYAKVSDTLADVLDRMLLPTPNQRFQSAQEVLDALAAQHSPVAPPINPPHPRPQPVAPPINPPPVSQGVRPVTAAPPNAPPPTPSPTPVAPITPPRRSTFSILEILGGAAFTGFEGGVLFVALQNLLGISGVSIGLLGMIIGGLIYVQLRRIIEGRDLPIIAGLTLAVLFVATFFGGGVRFPFIQAVLVVGILAAAGAIAVTALFRLVYLLLSRLL